MILLNLSLVVLLAKFTASQIRVERLLDAEDADEDVEILDFLGVEVG